MTPVGTLRSCFSDKFGVPRQAGLCPPSSGRIYLHPPFDEAAAFDGLTGTSHLWLSFIFHLTPDAPEKTAVFSPKVRPPRLGGNARIGVFATRSPNRPNRLGLSCVRFNGMQRDAQGLFLSVSDLDLVDGTPILDIKPYIPYCDSKPDATCSLAPEAPLHRLAVAFSDAARMAMAQLPADRYPQLTHLIEILIAQDPRPAYRGKSSDKKTYGMRLYDLEIRFSINEDLTAPCALVLSIANRPTE